MSNLISIIVPVYNVEKYLHKCIESILNQTYTDFELILINDGSTDKSLDICKYYSNIDSRVNVIHKENEGVSVARNVGISKSKGSWIVFVDSDDWISERYCEILLENAEREQAEMVICGYYRVCNNVIEQNNDHRDRVIYKKDEFIKKVLNVQNGYGFVHTKIIKKSVIDRITFNKDLKVAEDALFVLQVCENINKIIVIEESLYFYRINSQSTVRKYDPMYSDNYIKSMTYCEKYLKDKYLDNQEIVKGFYNFVSYHILLIAVNYCFNPKNNKSFFNQVRLLSNVIEDSLLKRSIKECNYNDLSISRKIALFTIKYRLYIITGIISCYRQNQIKGR